MANTSNQRVHAEEDVYQFREHSKNIQKLTRRIWRNNNALSVVHEMQNKITKAVTEQHDDTSWRYIHERRHRREGTIKYTRFHVVY